MTQFIQDNGFSAELLELVREVFLLNNIEYDPTSFVPVKVSSLMSPIASNGNNSVMQLSPLSSNFRLPNLRLFYKRKEISDVLEPYSLVLRNVDSKSTVHTLINEINLYLGNNLTLKEEDFYNVYVEQGTDKKLVLSAKTDSYFYQGDYIIPILNNEELLLTFSVTVYQEPPP